MHTLTAYIEKDSETGLYVAIVPGIPGAHTQAETLDELQANLKSYWNCAWKNWSLKINNI